MRKWYQEMVWVHHGLKNACRGMFFNTNMIHLFYESKENDVANYADHTTRYSCGTDIPTVISELQVRF